MIKHILTKPQFSNYTFKDEFNSDATYKVVRYIYNFDHTKISKVTGKSVNAFSYVTQIIHNSIIFVINEMKKQLNRDAETAKIVYDYLLHSDNKCLDYEPNTPINPDIAISTKYINSIADLTEVIDNVHKWANKHALINLVIKDNLKGATQIELFKAECRNHKVPNKLSFVS